MAYARSRVRSNAHCSLQPKLVHQHSSPQTEPSQPQQDVSRHAKQPRATTGRAPLAASLPGRQLEAVNWHRVDRQPGSREAARAVPYTPPVASYRERYRKRPWVAGRGANN